MSGCFLSIVPTGEANHAVAADTAVRMKDVPTLPTLPDTGVARWFRSGFLAVVDQQRGGCTSSGLSWKQLVRSSVDRTYAETLTGRSYLERKLGHSKSMGVVVLPTRDPIVLIQWRGWLQTGQVWLPCGVNCESALIWRNPTLLQCIGVALFAQHWSLRKPKCSSESRPIGCRTKHKTSTSPAALEMLSWSFDVDMASNEWKDFVNWPSNPPLNYNRWKHHAAMITNQVLKTKQLLVNLLQCVLTCFFEMLVWWQELVGQVFKGQAISTVAPAVTEWTTPSDKRSEKLIRNMWLTGQYCLVWRQQWGLQVGCVLGDRAIAPMSWTCKKQSVVSHSSAETRVISLGAGVRLEGLPFFLWA